MSDRNDMSKPAGGPEPMDDTAIVNPDVVGALRRETGSDVVLDSSEESFPASDPPSYSGSASVPADREPDPTGEQAAWHVEHEARSNDETAGALEQTDEPGASIPVPPDDARQA